MTLCAAYIDDSIYMQFRAARDATRMCLMRKWGRGGGEGTQGPLFPWPSARVHGALEAHVTHSFQCNRQRWKLWLLVGQILLPGIINVIFCPFFLPLNNCIMRLALQVKGNVESPGVSQGLWRRMKRQGSQRCQRTRQEVLFATCVYKPTKSRCAWTRAQRWHRQALLLLPLAALIAKIAIQSQLRDGDFCRR